MTREDSAIGATAIDQTYDLNNMVALVTGGSRGIGTEIARTFARHGAQVVVASRKAESCERVAASIREAGGRAVARACHIGELEQIEATVGWIGETFGRLDILVNNAATNPYFGPVTGTSPEAFQKSVDVNVRGYFFTTVHASALMRRGKGGSVVNIASISGVVPGPQQGIYSITKAAIISMTKVFAAECAATGIRVNAILPGIVDTRFSAALVSDSDMLAQYLPRIPMGRIGHPSEVAGAALYFASPASSYTTGACLVVDGGHLVK
jgi:NAD(P)-dependent dehydrogenase (short-subunit alcohol dehydrogenase family)